MNTIDKYLLHLESVGFDQLDEAVPAKDKRILQSLSRQLKSNVFLTENQANLLVKILKENKQHFRFPEHVNVHAPTWSAPFRKIDQIRILSIKDEMIVVEFTHSKRIRQIVSDLTKKIDGQMATDGTKKYLLPLTEKNVYVTLSALKNESFDIEDDLQQHYDTISAILKEANVNPFDFYKLSEDSPIIVKMQQEVDITNPLHIADNRLRYQYSSSPAEGNTLSVKIANRAAKRVYVDSKKTALTEVFASLKELNRFPVLVVMGSYTTNEAIDALAHIEKAVSSLGVTDPDVGVYFRLPTSTGETFNTSIRNLGYNRRLSNSTLVAAISNNQLPKFLFKEDWYPRTVISFVNNFKNNKASAFCDGVDLIMYYNKTQPASNDFDDIL